MDFDISPNNVQTTTQTTDQLSKKLSRLTSDIHRLATFRLWKERLHPTFSKGQFAKAGFYYIETEHKLKCEGCNFEIDLSKFDDSSFEHHRKEKPQCQFILAQCDLFLILNSQSTLSTSNTSQTNLSTADHQNSIHDNSNEQEDDLSSLKSFLNKLPKPTLDKLRANTFTNWPLITPNTQDMIIAGWVYTNIADRVICVYCNALFHKWTESDRPYEIHRLKSPHCPFVQSTDKKAINSSTAIMITTEPNTQAVVGAINTMYTLACRRYESFQNWPHSEDNPLPSTESFVDAGFFYTGDKHIVKCFYCNGALRNWQVTDDPKIEHARWYPQCAYIRQYIGEDLYQAIQRKNQQLRAQENSQKNATDQISKPALWSDDEIDRMTKARLDLPIVEKLRQAGFTMPIIRKTFEMQLRFKKDDFQTDNDLRLACLILNLQVKIINGNDRSLLIPEDWMKKYLEEQERNIQQPEPQQTRTSSSPAKNDTGIVKMIPSVATRPLIAQNTDEETATCVLCLTTERQIACLPCGHLTTCVACGHSLKTCPICRASVKAFVRIYV